MRQRPPWQGGGRGVGTVGGRATQGQRGAVTLFLRTPDPEPRPVHPGNSASTSPPFHPPPTHTHPPTHSPTRPNRFFSALSSRSGVPASPSRYSTTSTMCIRVWGPAREPSLVTWEMRNTAVLVSLATRSSAWVHSFTCTGVCVVVVGGGGGKERTCMCVRGSG
jgi:hypothetical protein